MKQAILEIQKSFPNLYKKIPTNFKEISGITKISDDILYYNNIPEGLLCLSKYNLGESNIEIKSQFKNSGIMFDVSRNAVFKVSYVKKMIERMAILGYNTLMLYTEDVYEISGEEFFGFMRGKYKKDEIKEIVSFAKIFGIEVIPCIQTLGHLEQFLRWENSGKYKDTHGVLLCGSEKTYELIEKMFKSLREIFETDKIHLGMDESFDMGTGEYFRKNGFVERFEIFQNHINKVVTLAKENGFVKSTVWSDMYFAVFNKGGGDSLYNADFSVGEHVKKLIPESLNLMYWNYWTREKENYLQMFAKHKEFSDNISMASGIGTWKVLTYSHGSFAATKAAIDASKEAGLETILFTMWMDDGAYCNLETALAGIFNTSEYLFFGKDENSNKDSYEKIFGEKYSTAFSSAKIANAPLDSVSVLWDDPLYSIYLKNCLLHENKNIIDESFNFYKNLEKELENISESSKNKNHSLLLAKLLKNKLELFTELQIYKENPKKISELKNKINILSENYIELEKSFRDIWMANYKPFGFEVLQNRFFGLAGRYKELILRIEELEQGKISKIDELFEKNSTFQNLNSNYNHIAFSSSMKIWS